jgi:acyl carrier protein
MTEHEIAESARAVLARRLKIKPDAITLETRLEELELDSLDLVTLAGEFEELFSVQIATKDLMKIRTFGDIVQQLSSKVASAA